MVNKLGLELYLSPVSVMFNRKCVCVCEGRKEMYVRVGERQRGKPLLALRT